MNLHKYQSRILQSGSNQRPLSSGTYLTKQSIATGETPHVACATKFKTSLYFDLTRPQIRTMTKTESSTLKKASHRVCFSTFCDRLNRVKRTTVQSEADLNPVFGAYLLRTVCLCHRPCVRISAQFLTVEVLNDLKRETDALDLDDQKAESFRSLSTVLQTSGSTSNRLHSIRRRRLRCGLSAYRGLSVF